MGLDVRGMKTEELTAENKVLQRKKNEIIERQHQLSAEVARRRLQEAADKVVNYAFGKSEEEIDALIKAAERKKERIKKANAERAAAEAAKKQPGGTP